MHDLSRGRGYYRSDFDESREKVTWGTLPFDLSHDAFDVTYPPVERQML